MSLSSSDQTLFQDHQTGLLTVQGWVNGLVDGVVPVAGGMIAIGIINVDNTNQLYGQEACDIFVQEIVARFRDVLPGNVEITRGASNTFFVWLPEVVAEDIQQQANQISKALYAMPIKVAEGIAIFPKAAMVAAPIAEKYPALAAIDAIMQGLARQKIITSAADMVASPSSIAINQQLEATRMFGMEKMVERVLAQLYFTQMQTETVIILAPLLAGKSRLLAAISEFLNRQGFPLALIDCHPSDQTVSCGLLVNIISRLLPFFPPTILKKQLQNQCESFPWLSSLFQNLRSDQATSAQALLEDQSVISSGMKATLLALAATQTLIVIINDLEFADSLSLSTLSAIQRLDNHGLRIIIGASPEEQGIPKLLQCFQLPSTSALTMPIFSRNSMLTYLQEVIPGAANPEIADSLFQKSAGLLLEAETTLRSWVVDGLLTVQNGSWSIACEEMEEQSNTGLQRQERERLAFAALVCPTSIEFLTNLWATSDIETQTTIMRGRALGYLKPMDLENPEQVEFIDKDEALALTEGLSQEMRTSAHATIAGLLEKSTVNMMERNPLDLAYHYQQAGKVSSAQQYMDIIKMALDSFLMNAIPDLSMESYRQISETVWSDEDLPLLVDVILSIRMVGVGFRFYPPHSSIIIQNLDDAIIALNRYFIKYPQLVISVEEHTVAFEGQILDRRDVAIAVKDYFNWLMEAKLQAIGLFTGITSDELTSFFEAMAHYDPLHSSMSLQQVLLDLPLEHLKVNPRNKKGGASFWSDRQFATPSHITPGIFNTQNVPSAGAIKSEGAPVSGVNYALVPLMPGLTLPSITTTNPTDTARSSAALSSTMLAPAILPALANSPIAPVSTEETVLSPVLANPHSMTVEDWQHMPSLLREASANFRQIMMSNLTNWLCEVKNINQPEITESIDRLLLQQLEEEEDLEALEQTTNATAERLQSLAEYCDWTGVLSLLTLLKHRQSATNSEIISQRITQLFQSFAESANFRFLIENGLFLDTFSEIHSMINVMGEIAWSPFIHILATSEDMQIRIRMLKAISGFGNKAQWLLIQELQKEYPWYVYRNILTTLAEFATEDILPNVIDFTKYHDSRVRVAAINVVIRAGKEKAVDTLLAGMDDEELDVRIRAASLIGLCRHPRVLEKSIRILQPSRQSREEPEAIQMTICLGLGEYSDTAARECLLYVLYPPAIRLFHRKSAEIRSAAVTALGNHINHPQVQQAIKQACNDRHPLIRQAATRIWQQFQGKNGT